MLITSTSTSTVGEYQPLGTRASQSSSATTAAAEDSVKLSTTAQVSALHQNGMSVKQIAASMGLTTSEVDTDLGITTTSSAPAGGGGGGTGKGAPPAGKSSATSQSTCSTTTTTTTTSDKKKA